jgi:hypothetical protein
MRLYNEKGNGGGASYRKIVNALKHRRAGALAADICADTALPLSTVRELLPKAADEFLGRLEVTESGEIRYSFPRGFRSRYRGLLVNLKKIVVNIAVFAGRTASFLFKIWILFMLVGYFLVFVSLALASVFFMAAVQSKNSNGRRRTRVYFGPNLFSLLWRFWFFTELGRDHKRSRSPRPSGSRGRPMYRSLFSFVFGEEDPNKDWDQTEKKALIALIQSRNGIVSLPEYMAVCGADSLAAGEGLLAFCAEFGGSPEATEEGTIVYRFDELLLRSALDQGAKPGPELSPPVKQPRVFSANTGNRNAAFVFINLVNLIAGAYFSYHAFVLGAGARSGGLYAFTRALLEGAAQDPRAVAGIALGIVPLVFSLLFWLIPALRYLREKRENRDIKRRNLLSRVFCQIWEHPLAVNGGADREEGIKIMGAYSVPEVEAASAGLIYRFTELQREKSALETYRGGMKKTGPGKVVFDSE